MRRRARAGLTTGALLVLAACGGSPSTPGGASAPAQPAMSAAAPTGAGQPTGAQSAGAVGSPEQVVPTPIEVAGRAVQYHGEKSVAGQSSVEVTMEDFYFAPTALAGTPGQRITVALVNAGQVEHTFTIEDQGVNVVLGPGAKGSVTVTLPSSGQLPFVCTYHVGAGMAGVLAAS